MTLFLVGVFLLSLDMNRLGKAKTAIAGVAEKKEDKKEEEDSDVHRPQPFQKTFALFQSR